MPSRPEQLLPEGKNLRSGGTCCSLRRAEKSRFLDGTEWRETRHSIPLEMTSFIFPLEMTKFYDRYFTIDIALEMATQAPDRSIASSAFFRATPQR
jgi:hypothetical protein